MNRQVHLKKPTSLLARGGALAVIIAACGMTESIDYGKAGNLPENGVANHALVQLDSCDELASYAKKAAIQRIMAYAEMQLQELEECWSHGGTGIADAGADDWTDVEMDGDSRPPVSVDSDVDVDADADGDFGDELGGEPSTGNDSPKDSHSETNVQEAGVDEADLIKTDGKNLYALTTDTLVVVEAGENGALTELGRVVVGGYATELFLYNDLVVVFSELGRQDVDDEMKMSAPSWAKQTGEYYPEWDSEWYFYNSGYSQIAIIDASNPAKPVVSRKIKYAGSYVTSRRIGNSLRAVISTSTPGLDIPFTMNAYQYCSMPESMGRAVFEAAYEAYIEEAEKLIDDLSIDEILPKKQDIIGDSATTDTIIECSDVYGPHTAAGTGLLTIVSLDLDQPTKKQKDIAVLGQKGLVYATQSSLYLTTASDYVYNAWLSGLWSEETSGIHKFDISSDPGRAIYKASGSIEGRMLNQFCLGEHEGYLRVATTTGHRWDFSTWDNHVSVFEEKKGELELVGQVSGLGKEEQEEIYAARFLGDRGFVVTFRQTDPLYTLDMSDHYNPKVVGEWHGPGFSTYLHPFGEDHIITVGRQDWRIALSLYDLTDLANPNLIERHFLDDSADLYSEALDNHKAFSFDAKRNLLFMPYHGYWFADEYKEGFNTGILVFGVGLNGFTDNGALSLMGDGVDERSESNAKRSAYIDDTLYGISRCRISSAPIDNPANTLDTIKLYTGDWCNDYGNGGYDEWEGGDIDIDVDWEDEWDTGWEEEPVAADGGVAEEGTTPPADSSGSTDADPSLPEKN